MAFWVMEYCQKGERDQRKREFGEDVNQREGVVDRANGVVCMLGLILGLALHFGVASRLDQGTLIIVQSVGRMMLTQV